MAVDGVLLEAHLGELGQEAVDEAGVGQEPEAGAGVVDHDELVELVADALGRHDVEPVGHGLDRGGELGDRLKAVPGDEPGGPQHAERVVGERHLGRQRRTKAAGGEVVGPTEGIDEHGLGKGERHGVDGEVAAGEVGLDRVGELDGGLAGVRVVGLGPVGGDLEVPAVLAAADGAEALTLGPHGVGPALEQSLGVGGEGVGGEVDVAARRHVAAEEEVADDTAHEVEAEPGRGEALGQRGRALEDGAQPVGDHGRRGYRCHRRAPAGGVAAEDEGCSVSGDRRRACGPPRRPRCGRGHRWRRPRGGTRCRRARRARHPWRP